ncbi:MAG: hypothetical protein IT338_17555 [Thermomicrobiales bacterium]|nr:hypothetical protein [Thermomicrobiales bacterium]
MSTFTAAESLAMMFHHAVKAEPTRPLQICLPYTGPIGPGIVRVAGEAVGAEGIYTIETQAQMGQGPKARILTLPITFAAEDLVWFSTGAVEQEQPLVVPLNGGGLIVPRS